MKRTYTRQELYDLVWSTPIATLAKQLDISDRGLAKTCLRYHVPVPGRGYWAKVEAGQSATKTPLWQIENPALETIHIGGFKPAVNPYVAFAIQRAGNAVEQSKIRQKAKLTPEKSFEPSIAKEPLVLEPVKRPHSSISPLTTALKSAKRDQHGELSIPGIRVHPASVTRVTAFLHHLVLALEKRDIALSYNEKGIGVAIGPDDVRFEIAESRRREKHEPTPIELKKRQDHEQRRELARRRGQWLPWESFWPEYDYIHSGKLTLHVLNWAAGARKNWGDGKHQSLESMLEAIADGILFHLVYEKAHREEQVAEQRRREHMARRRELHKKRQEREANRLGFLRKLAELQREVADLNVTVAKASELLPQASPEYLRMIAWAENRLAHLQAQNQLESLTASLREQNLFPDSDEFHDPEGDPPPPRYSWGE
ncbi:hypothetical protein [Aminobacter sp. MET-1]|uniref:hypothetical protein n=1 Tax=Aminobacter sp. MET-1 TaxID=2951085 RepID=UPI00226A106C|nr:hypothetical protein [Aminobacter sp. MET-1]MCX8568800.1 hypothetical protein [Aminobacter sp. MET-1]